MNTNEYNRCVDLYSDHLFNFAQKMLGSRSDAQDVVQHVFEKFWIKHKDVNFEKAKSYLFTSVYRASIDKMRKSARIVNMGDTVYKGNTHENSHRQFEIRDALNDALSKIPEIQKTLVILRDYHGHPYEEIAEITGLNVSQVKVYLYRARKKLQKSLAHLKYA